MTTANGTPNGTPEDKAGLPAPRDAESIEVRHGMFGASGSGDTSGYGKLVRTVAFPGPAPAPTAARAEPPTAKASSTSSPTNSPARSTKPASSSTRRSRRSSSTAASSPSTCAASRCRGSR